MVRGHQPFHALAQVVPQVLPVGDLGCIGRTVPDAVGVSAGPVPADHLHTRVGAQPAAEVPGFPAGEHIHRPAAPRPT